MLGTFREVARHFSTAFLKSILVSLQKDLVIVRAQLKLEVFLSSSLLTNSPNFKAKVLVRLKFEVLQ